MTSSRPAGGQNGGAASGGRVRWTTRTSAWLAGDPDMQQCLSARERRASNGPDRSTTSARGCSLPLSLLQGRERQTSAQDGERTHRAARDAELLVDGGAAHDI